MAEGGTKLIFAKTRYTRGLGARQKGERNEWEAVSEQELDRMVPYDVDCGCNRRVL